MPTGNGPRIVVIGGGTGSFTLLGGLKNHVKDLTALVNMADDGGSTGVLRDELGVLPPGDVRQCLVALSGSPHLRDLFNYRFPDGSVFGGHSFGNLFLSAVEKMTNDFNGAVELASEVLKLEGKVLPITLDDCVLVLERTNELDITGEKAIGDTNIIEPSPTIKLKTPARIFDKAAQAIASADLVVIAPGDLYTSLAPALIVEGVGQALSDTPARIVYVANLINKPSHTKNYALHNYVNELERLAGSKFIDYVLYNTDEPTDQLLKRYAADGEFPVIIDQATLAQAPYESVGGAFLGMTAKPDPNDTWAGRTLIRHDNEAIARALLDIYSSAA